MLVGSDNVLDGDIGGAQAEETVEGQVLEVCTQYIFELDDIGVLHNDFPQLQGVYAEQSVTSMPFPNSNLVTFRPSGNLKTRWSRSVGAFGSW